MREDAMNINEETEEILDKIADLEEYTKKGQPPPRCRGYRFKVNGQPYIVEAPIVTGSEVLTIASKIPPSAYTLRVKMAGHKPRKVDLAEEVNLRNPGIEKFKALPRDQTEG